MGPPGLVWVQRIFRQGIAPLLLTVVALLPLAALDIDLRLVGYSFLPVESSSVGPDGLIIVLKDGTARRIDLRYTVLIGTDGSISRPQYLHQHWLRLTFTGDRGSLVCTSLPILLVVGFCLLLDVLLLVRYFRRRSRRPEIDRDGPSPRSAARESAGSGPPRP